MYIRNTGSESYVVNDILLFPQQETSILGSLFIISRVDENGNKLPQYESTVIYYDYYTRSMRIEKQGEPRIALNGVVNPTIYIK